MKTDAVVFSTILKSAFKSLQIQVNESMSEYINNLVNIYKERHNEAIVKGESYDIGDADSLALDAFIYKMERCIDEAKAIKAFNKDIKPILKHKK